MMKELKEGDKVVLTELYVGWGDLKPGDVVRVTSVTIDGIRVWDDSRETVWYIASEEYKRLNNSIEKIT